MRKMRSILSVLSLIVCPLIAADEADGSLFSYQEPIVIQFAVADLDRSVQFYTETLGLAMRVRVDAIGWARIMTANDNVDIGLGLKPAEEAIGTGAASVNLAVGDIDAVRQTLEARGVAFLGPTIEIPGVVRLADFEDPDGNRIRLAGAPRPSSN